MASSKAYKWGFEGEGIGGTVLTDMAWERAVRHWVGLTHDDIMSRDCAPQMQGTILHYLAVAPLLLAGNAL